MSELEDLRTENQELEKKLDARRDLVKEKARNAELKSFFAALDDPDTPADVRAKIEGG